MTLRITFNCINYKEKSISFTHSIIFKHIYLKMSAQKCSFAATDVKHPIASRAILHKTFSDSFLGDEP